MTIYEINKYILQQDEESKHIIIAEKIDETTARIVFHASRDKTTPMLTEQEGKKFIEEALNILFV